MKRSEDRILTTHVGSIIRPESLLALASQKIGPPKDVAAYAAALQSAVKDVRFARIVGRENVIAGSDCGFAQAETLRRVHPKVMWAKFESLAAGAHIATAELWGRS